MNCNAYNKGANQTTRLPLMLPCCGVTLCKQCALANQSENTPKICPINKYGSQNFIIDNLKANQDLEKPLDETSGVFCDKHLVNQAELYCPIDNALVCKACVATTCSGHECQQIQNQDILNYNDKILEFLRNELKRIQIMISKIESYQLNQNQFNSEQYLNIVKDVQDTLKHRLNEQQWNQIQFPFSKLNQQLQEEETKQELFNQQLIQNINCKLLKQDDYELLNEYLNITNLKLELIYRGSDHGFSYDTFHFYCDSYAPTLTVALSEHDQLFGGYASVSWRSVDPGQHKQDKQAFLFQLTKKFKLTQYQNQDKAVYHNSNNGPVFGGGCDLVLGNYNYTNFNEEYSCWSNISDLNLRTYSLPVDIQQIEQEAMKYLAGSYQFKLKEIEVFKVIIE